MPLVRRESADRGGSGLKLGLAPAAWLLCFLRAAIASQACDDLSRNLDERSLLECESGVLLKADGELNTLYGRIYRRLHDDVVRKHVLVGQEKRWISAKERDCVQEADDYDVIGMTRSTAIVRCETRKTEGRVRQLSKAYREALP